MKKYSKHIKNSAKYILTLIGGFILGTASDITSNYAIPILNENNYKNQLETSNTNDNYLKGKKYFDISNDFYDNSEYKKSTEYIGKSIDNFKESFKENMIGSAYYIAVIYSSTIPNVILKNKPECIYWMKKSIELENPNANLCICT